MEQYAEKWTGAIIFGAVLDNELSGKSNCTPQKVAWKDQ